VRAARADGLPRGHFHTGTAAAGRVLRGETQPHPREAAIRRKHRQQKVTAVGSASPRPQPAVRPRRRESLAASRSARGEHPANIGGHIRSTSAPLAEATAVLPAENREATRNVLLTSAPVPLTFAAQHHFCAGSFLVTATVPTATGRPAPITCCPALPIRGR
jgi:hypothetical protein